MLTYPSRRSSSKAEILVTMGDPAGVGPEIIMKSMASPEVRGLAIFVILGDARLLEEEVKKYPGIGKIAVHRIDKNGPSVDLQDDAVNIVDPGPDLAHIEAGKPSADGAKKALNCIDAAIRMVKDASCDIKRAIVTAPVSKEMMARVHPGFVGHTEYLRDGFSVKMVTMVLTGKTMCVIPVTRHIPLRDVASSLTVDLICGTLEQVIENRKAISGKDDALITVSALNPHCGEGGKVGREEIDIIAPAVERSKKIYANIEGPISADVVFYKAMRKKTDIVVAMYHDQCLAPFKMVDFDNGVNVTLGLGAIRTSPDHGTAFDIAGKGIADAGSMIRAIRLAARALGDM